MLKRIIRALKFHGRLGLPLKGHTDCGELPIPADDGRIDYSEGNLRTLRQLMMECDDRILLDHFKHSGKNAMYISPSSQNASVDTIGKVMQRQVILEICNAQCFTILADETTERLSTLSFTYFHNH